MIDFKAWYPAQGVSNEEKQKWADDLLQTVKAVSYMPGNYWGQSGDSMILLCVDETGEVEVFDLLVRGVARVTK